MPTRPTPRTSRATATRCPTCSSSGTSEDGVGLFGAGDYSSIRGVGLVDVDVTGGDGVGSLLGGARYALVRERSGRAMPRAACRAETRWAAWWVGPGRACGAATPRWTCPATSWWAGWSGTTSATTSPAATPRGTCRGRTRSAGWSAPRAICARRSWRATPAGNVSGTGARLSASSSGLIICGFFADDVEYSGGGVGGLAGQLVRRHQGELRHGRGLRHGGGRRAGRDRLAAAGRVPATGIWRPPACASGWASTTRTTTA